MEKWLDQIDDEGLLKNGKIRVIVGFRAISKNKSAIGISRKVFKKKGLKDLTELIVGISSSQHDSHTSGKEGNSGRLGRKDR